MMRKRAPLLVAFISSSTLNPLKRTNCFPRLVDIMPPQAFTPPLNDLISSNNNNHVNINNHLHEFQQHPLINSTPPTQVAVPKAHSSPLFSSAAMLAFLQTPSWKRSVMLLLTVSMLAFTLLVNYHRGAQRIFQFWSSVMPLLAEFKWLKFRGNHFLSEESYLRKTAEFHRKTAPKAAQLAIDMGGIYVKLGQVISTMAVGLLPDEYVQALRPLQDGIPPRPMEDIRHIIEQSTGQRLEDVFEYIEPTPIGAASIAQAHKAILKKKHKRTYSKRKVDDDSGDDTVIVKVQYPEVAELFHADLNNLEMLVRLINPRNLDLVQSIRERHINELDFRLEAAHLRECRQNLQRHGVEPKLVRIPQVRNETGLCTQHVLVMEYLEGTPLNSAIEEEQDRMARALGKESGKELRDLLLEKIGEHLEQTHAHNTTVADHQDPVNFYIDRDHVPEAKWWHRFVLDSAGARVFRTYAGLKDQFRCMRHNLGGIFGQRQSKRRRHRPIQLGKVLKTLIHVHGLQLLKDGVYNADPHPGNILILPDGRLGLLDYGMVGRLEPTDQRTIAEVIVALHQKDKHKVHSVYQKYGYRATWGSVVGRNARDIYDEPNIVHRFATFHFDKFDLSPIHLMHPSSGSKQYQPIPTMKILETTRELAVPDWIEQGRRLSGLLAGISLQAARPVSMAKEWYQLAKETLLTEEAFLEGDGNETDER